MTEDEFKNLFDSKDIKDVADVFEAIVAEKPPTPKKAGLWYAHDEQDANGHSVSVYALNMGDKTVAWVMADNDIVETDATLIAPLGNIPEFVTPHRITIWNGTRTESYVSKGLALRYPQSSGVHIDTNTVRAYVMPRLPKILGRLYGV